MSSKKYLRFKYGEPWVSPNNSHLIPLIDIFDVVLSNAKIYVNVRGKKFYTEIETVHTYDCGCRYLYLKNFPSEFVNSYRLPEDEGDEICTIVDLKFCGSQQCDISAATLPPAKYTFPSTIHLVEVIE